MQFLKVNGWGPGTKALTARLQGELKSGKHVLWLISGGSNIAPEVAIMKALADETTENLAIFLTDERYGEVGHIDSNAKQLYDAGFQPKDAIFVPTLAPGFSLDETKERYEQAIRRAAEHADTIVAQFGIGADGHLAGILPHSEAADADGWVSAYETPHYTRVTLTFEALRNISVAFAMAFGEEKKPALLQLRDNTPPLTDQPSQILKELPEAYIYNDQIGDES